MLGFLLWFSLSLGYQKSTAMIDNVLFEYPPFYTDIAIHAENKWLDIYGSVKTDMRFNLMEQSILWPSVDTYTVGAKASVGIMSLSIEHYCTHPIAPSRMLDDITFDGARTKIEVTIRSAP